MPDPPARAFPDRPVVGVGAVVLDEDGRVVLIRRAHAPLAGSWSLPGGALELGESLVDAVAREVLEETGLQVEVGPIVDVFEYLSREADDRLSYHYVVVDYVCRVRAGSLRAGSDAAEVVAADREALAGFGLSDKAIAIIETAYGLAGPGWSSQT